MNYTKIQDSRFRILKNRILDYIGAYLCNTVSNQGVCRVLPLYEPEIPANIICEALAALDEA